MVWAPMRSPQWMTASAPSALASWTACASGSARSWLSETMQIFIGPLSAQGAMPANRPALSAHQWFWGSAPGRRASVAAQPEGGIAMPGLVRPHCGGALKPLALQGDRLAEAHRRARSLPPLVVSSREKVDFVMLGLGGFTPLDGFMTHADWQGVCDGMRTAAGVFWPIPITLSTTEEKAAALREGTEVALEDPDDGSILAILRVTGKYRIDKAHECRSVFKTTDAAHPGVKMVMEQGDVNLAGPGEVLTDGGFKAQYGALFQTAPDTRADVERLGWSRVAAVHAH